MMKKKREVRYFSALKVNAFLLCGHEYKYLNQKMEIKKATHKSGLNEMCIYM